MPAMAMAMALVAPPKPSCRPKLPAPDDAPDSFRFRRGFFLGDGTGAGKGRVSAGILLDTWAQGRRKALK
jgi:hypothetical protein